ncbi:MAG: peptide chain release factor-like protein [Candidatus Omnitrophica bacterium]|nr:peptide chain release factor-like protein [Candidatus Omnitrophota bacterium]
MKEKSNVETTTSNTNGNKTGPLIVLPIFPVSPSRQKSLQERAARLNIRSGQIKEVFISSSGPGGQNVNRRATCVCLKHIPTGIVVRCQKERSQGLNRFLAWRGLLDKIEKYRTGCLQAEKEKIAKIRRQKRRRYRRAKEKMLAEKHRRSEKKQLRGRVRFFNQLE